MISTVFELLLAIKSKLIYCFSPLKVTIPFEVFSPPLFPEASKNVQPLPIVPFTEAVSVYDFPEI